MAKAIVSQTEFVAMVRFADGRHCWATLAVENGHIVATEVPREWDLSGIEQFAAALDAKDPSAQDVVEGRA